MRDITFLIHYAEDSPDRRRDLIAVVEWLYAINAPVKVWCDTPTPEEIKGKCEYVEENTLIDGKWIWRTRALNNLAKSVDTPFIAIHDADTILPTEQIVEALRILREGEVKVVWPYDGIFRRMNEEPTVEFCNTGDTEALFASEDCMGYQKRNAKPLGGSIFADRNEYFRIGGENEKYVAYGPEDKDFYLRASTFSRIHFTLGFICHLDHSRSQNSGTKHPFYSNSVVEYMKMWKMAKEPDQLRAYVKETFNWARPWVNEL